MSVQSSFQNVTMPLKPVETDTEPTNKKTDIIEFALLFIQNVFSYLVQNIYLPYGINGINGFLGQLLLDWPLTTGSTTFVQLVSVYFSGCLARLKLLLLWFFETHRFLLIIY